MAVYASEIISGGDAPLALPFCNPIHCGLMKFQDREPNHPKAWHRDHVRSPKGVVPSV
jgi:hypothetical protein